MVTREVSFGWVRRDVWDGTSSRVYYTEEDRTRDLACWKAVEGRRAGADARDRGATIRSGGGVNSANGDGSGRAPCVRRPWRRASRSFPADFVCGARNGARAWTQRRDARSDGRSAVFFVPSSTFDDSRTRYQSKSFVKYFDKKSRLIIRCAAGFCDFGALAALGTEPGQLLVSFLSEEPGSMCDAVRGPAPLPGAREPYFGR